MEKNSLHLFIPHPLSRSHVNLTSHIQTEKSVEHSNNNNNNNISTKEWEGQSETFTI